MNSIYVIYTLYGMVYAYVYISFIIMLAWHIMVKNGSFVVYTFF